MKTQNEYLEPVTKAALKLALSVSTIGIVTSLSATLANVAEAAKFKFSGQVTNYGFNNGIVQDGSVALGKVVSGSYEFDCPSALCQFDGVRYWDASPNSRATVDIGNYTFQTVPYESFGPSGSDWNMILQNSTDWFTIGIEEKNGLLDMNRVPDSAIARLEYSSIELQSSLGSLGKLTINSSAWDAVPELDGYDVWIEADITSIKKVPEPAFVLSLLALGGLGVASKLRKSNQ